MNRNLNPIRFSRNIRRILKLKSNAKSSVKVSSEGKRRYWLPCLKNTILVIAITLAETFRINEIARCLPIKASDKQKRLLRFLGRSYPTAPVMKQWAFVV